MSGRLNAVINAMYVKRVMLAALLGLAALPTDASQAGAAPVRLTLELTPRSAPDDNKRIHEVEVSLRFVGLRSSAGTPLLTIPLVVSNVDTVATSLRNLSAHDANGPIHLESRDLDAAAEAARDAESGGPARVWSADRAIAGTLHIRYCIDADSPLPPRGPAPPFAFTSDGGGVSAAGHIFVLLPPQKLRYLVTVSWDLSAAPRGSRGMSSLGEGRVTSQQPMTAAEVRETFFMAGAIHTWPEKLPKNGFFAVWQGAPDFDAAALMSWTGTLYGHYSQFFGQRSPPPYGVFVRFNPINAGGGVGLFHSFVLTYGKGGSNDIAELKTTLAHEMFHTFQPFIVQPPGLASSWFGEGLAVVYEVRLPLRFAMLSPEDFLRTTNFSAARYYTSIMATAPNSDVAKRFWADTRIRTLPYDRGMLYFKVVDAELRQASGGSRSLDDLMLRMLSLQQSGKSLSNADWEETLEAALGPESVREFHAFLDGRMPVPPSDAFGPCFQRITKPLRRYELGFDPAVLAEPQRVVRGLIPNSAAADAGLRDGDEIVVPVPQDGIQGHQEEKLVLSVRRLGEVFPISYLPRGETVDAYQWQRVGGVPDSSCAQ